VGARGELTEAGVRSERVAALIDAYVLYRDDLLAFVRRRMGGDAMGAEEAVQETFLRAWRSLNRFDSDTGTIRMWLYAICRNACADAASARARHARADLLATDGSEIVDDPTADRLAARSNVRDVLRILPAAQRDAIVAVHLEDRPYADVARDLGVPVGTVKSRVHLGLRSARHALVAA
jgi:RNA polymerase sigma-70 factor (ECF subfamily)